MSTPIEEFLGKIYRVRRVAWMTVIGFLVWPAALLMAWSYREERKYWLGVFCASLIATAIVLIILAIKGVLG